MKHRDFERHERYGQPCEKSWYSSGGNNRMISDWLDCHSWDPTLLMEKRPVIQAEQEPVEPAQRASVHVEPQPGEIAWLYQEHGGEA